MHLPRHSSKQKRGSIHSVISGQRSDLTGAEGPEAIYDRKQSCEKALSQTHSRRTSLADSLVGSIRGLGRKVSQKGSAVPTEPKLVLAPEPAVDVPLPSSPIDIPTIPPALSLDLGPAGFMSPSFSISPEKSRQDELLMLTDPSNTTTGAPVVNRLHLPQELEANVYSDCRPPYPATPGSLLRTSIDNLRFSPLSGASTPMPGTNLSLELDGCNNAEVLPLFERNVESPRHSPEKAGLRRMQSLNALADSGDHDTVPKASANPSEDKTAIEVAGDVSAKKEYLHPRKEHACADDIRESDHHAVGKARVMPAQTSDVTEFLECLFDQEEEFRALEDILQATAVGKMDIDLKDLQHAAAMNAPNITNPPARGAAVESPDQRALAKSTGRLLEDERVVTEELEQPNAATQDADAPCLTIKRPKCWRYTDTTTTDSSNSMSVHPTSPKLNASSSWKPNASACPPDMPALTRQEAPDCEVNHGDVDLWARRSAELPIRLKVQPEYSATEAHSLGGDASDEGSLKDPLMYDNGRKDSVVSAEPEIRAKPSSDIGPRRTPKTTGAPGTPNSSAAASALLDDSTRSDASKSVRQRYTPVFFRPYLDRALRKRYSADCVPETPASVSYARGVDSGQWEFTADDWLRATPPKRYTGTPNDEDDLMPSMGNRVDFDLVRSQRNMRYNSLHTALSCLMPENAERERRPPRLMPEDAERERHPSADFRFVASAIAAADDELQLANFENALAGSRSGSPNKESNFAEACFAALEAGALIKDEGEGERHESEPPTAREGNLESFRAARQQRRQRSIKKMRSAAHGSHDEAFPGAAAKRVFTPTRPGDGNRNRFSVLPIEYGSSPSDLKTDQSMSGRKSVLHSVGP